MFKITPFVFILLIDLAGCSLMDEQAVVDEGEDIHFVFDDGLNDDPNFRLPKDANGFYSMTLTKEGQNIQRISVRLLNSNNILESKCCGKRHTIRWSNNLNWWLLSGDTVAHISKTFINPLTGELIYTNLPPLLNWKDELVPTINASSITDETTGRASTVIAPIGIMKGDTMVIRVKYTHLITSSEPNSSFFTTIGEKELTDSVKIILK
ncbi:hypothetical protein [Algoriphagus sanaruensis]|uniref:Uncharacterized protein n=1 Tax=Algoriphagus sanaruensis TaxID=1727163 RepID=A0A142ERV4_9BACT|nr:hypothetical protein [Algoriphagus sanaruensis]AMQ57859.1 hypothetical protein AO498_15505 [Algoriphagus sanaruensis]